MSYSEKPKVSFWLRLSQVELDFITYAVMAIIIVSTLWGVREANLWRINHFPHAQATITRMWPATVNLSHGRTKAVTLAEIAFVRTHLGKSYDCKNTIEVGEPDTTFRVGDHLDVVPRTGSCYNALIAQQLTTSR
ncbi:hypothetical protein [Rhizobium hainanense]|uniref:Uncharacterized protein n=1 Tax=Rhizobium hainanense TaxID=52131 RepID=A0A1C3WF06_9HYPH|nr:hypothetical protein [Rhizobium hainanense]SCB38647.1 hypothetical protein GA0061100_11765 [Rhizobium hainanense]